jgi:arylsulfatase A-like enzyme
MKLRGTVWLAVGLWWGLGELPVGLAAARPNVVIFLADDAGWGDYSVSGNRQVRTPHIDSLANEGVSLERFYVCPVCSPTRAEFLTGRYHPRTGVSGVSTGHERLNLDEATLAEAFRAAGYATGAFGKWHNGSQWPYHPLARGFQEFFGYTSGHWGEYFDPLLEHNGEFVRARGYIVDICTDRALAFIDRHRDQPFLCYIPFTTPHSPWAVPDEYWRRFRDQPIMQRATVPDQERLDETRCVLAMLENQDDNVGRVLRKLEEHGLGDNTLVLYFSDNGPNSWRWNGGLKGRKGTTDEGGVRSVCFLRWRAGLPRGRRVPHLAGAIDLLPTLTSLAGISRVGDKPLDGRDLTPLLRDDPVDWPERLLFSSWNRNVSVCSQTHRLDHQGRLYDLRHDPGQTTPVNDAQPELAAQMQAAARAWRREMFGAEDAESTSPRPKAAAGSRSVDPRPFPVGYREFPRTWLPARDGEPLGGVRRSASAPNSSYFVNWTRLDDAVVWEIDVHTSGRYAVELFYTCPVADAGSTIELSFGDSRLRGQVQPGWDPPLYTNQDTLPRPAAESPMKEFRPLQLGTMVLKKGRGPLTVRAVEIPGREVMHLRALSLTLLPDE